MTVQLSNFQTLQSINYGVSLINAPTLWKHGFKGEGINIAVIDSGIDKEHDELKYQIIDGYNFSSENASQPKNISDKLGHGTHVAGIIAASNKNGIIGIAPQAKLLILKVIDGNGVGDSNALLKALNFAIDWVGPNGETIDVINLSLGGREDDPSLRNAVHRAYSKNIFIVAAAGNSGDGKEDTDEILYPGYYEQVIQVSAINESLSPAAFDDTNKNIDFLAPGVEIQSTYPNNSYFKMSGTSMAAPHISGSIALILNFFKVQNIPISYQRVYQYLVDHSIQIKDYSFKTQGHGIFYFQESR